MCFWQTNAYMVCVVFVYKPNRNAPIETGDNNTTRRAHASTEY